MIWGWPPCGMFIYIGVVLRSLLFIQYRCFIGACCRVSFLIEWIERFDALPPFKRCSHAQTSKGLLLMMGPVCAKGRQASTHANSRRVPKLESTKDVPHIPKLAGKKLNTSSLNHWSWCPKNMPNRQTSFLPSMLSVLISPAQKVQHGHSRSQALSHDRGSAKKKTVTHRPDWSSIHVW